MADADVPITAGSGTKIDTRTVGAGTDEHRQVVVVGDPSTAAAVAAVTAANGLAVDVTRLPALAAGTNNIGDVDVLTLPSIPAGNNNIGDVDIASVPTLTKGTQGSTGFSVQDLKDSGRVNIAWTVDQFVTTGASEAMLTFTESRDGAATSTTASKTITNGKRLRITSMALTVYAGGTTPAISRVLIKVRVNTAGAVATSSPIQHVLGVGVAAAAKSMSVVTHQFPDGIEFLGNGTVTIGFSVTSIDWVTTTNTPVVSLAVTAFEY
jgi:hypothetical protein